MSDAKFAQEPWDSPVYTCPWCRTAFSPTFHQRRNRKQGNSEFSYCKIECRYAAIGNLTKLQVPPGIKGKRGPVRGPCQQCGEMYRSHHNRFFCSLQCYIRSPKFVAAQREADKGAGPVAKSCRGCGVDFEVAYKGRKYRHFCRPTCRRKYFADRFDRWVANPESIALPQNYDEFLDRETLSCPVDGCEWEGANLSIHCNHVHGIPSDRFKEILGFNKTTGLCTPAVSEALRSRDNCPGLSAEALAEMRPKTSGGRAELRPEGREHARKMSADLATTIDPNKPPVPCRHCGVPVSQMMIGKRVFCSPACQQDCHKALGRARRLEKKHPLICSKCGASFLGTKYQNDGAAAGKPVACSGRCRARLNRRPAKENG
jgi:hypothetical protein